MGQLIENPRAKTAQRFWRASQAWYNRQGQANGWTFQDMIDELRSLTFIMGPIAFQAQDLLQLVIEDQNERPLKNEGRLYYFPIPIPTSNFTQVSNPEAKAVVYG